MDFGNNTKPNILVVEDDAAINDVVRSFLGKAGYACTPAYSGTEARLLMQDAGAYDLVICDLMLPGMRGEDVVSIFREGSDAPVIVISAKSDVSSKVDLLRIGADDYLVKPFSVEELLARLRVALRRLDAGASTEEEAVYENGDLRIDYRAGSATCRGEEIHLTPIEYKLLCLLARNTGKVLTHTYILREVWGTAFTSDIPSLRVFMATLRKKIEPDPSHPIYIQTHVGIGYRMMRVGD